MSSSTGRAPLAAGFANGGVSFWYRAAGRLVGVLTHLADNDYDTGQQLIAGSFSA